MGGINGEIINITVFVLIYCVKKEMLLCIYIC